MAHTSFGTFILGKKSAPGPLGELAQAAGRDPAFPREGDFKAVSKRLNQHEAPPEFHEALENAEAEWRASH